EPGALLARLHRDSKRLQPEREPGEGQQCAALQAMTSSAPFNGRQDLREGFPGDRETLAGEPSGASAPACVPSGALHGTGVAFRPGLVFAAVEIEPEHV